MRDRYPEAMTGLADIITEGLDVVLCGTAPGLESDRRGHYYAGPGNAFWRLLHESGLTPVRLTPLDDAALPSYGIGLTDLARNVAQSHDKGLPYDPPRLETLLTRYRPRWVAFTSLEAARAAGAYAGRRRRDVVAGEQDWLMGPSRVWALPSPSGRNSAMPYAVRLEEWTRMALAVRAKYPDQVETLDAWQPRTPAISPST